MSARMGENRLSVDPTCKFLAYPDFGNLTIRDTATKKIVLRDDSTISNPSPQPGTNPFPRFYDEGRVVFFAPPVISEQSRLSRYKLASDGTWQPDPLQLANVTSYCHFVSYTDSQLVTDDWTIKETNKPGWLPETVWDWGIKLFALRCRSHRLQFWDVHSGKMQREFSFFEPIIGWAPFGDLLQVSEDAKWLTVENGAGVTTVYDLMGRRSIWRWVSLVGLTFLAVWCIWPRKVKVTPSPLALAGAAA